ncbi:histidinol phosphate phosphatase H [Testicularia cyperi]|uniref:histidinol-phosphatase n=1 Tax=Testicularia cyperi TaxID=1882483 RepID=A0A317XLU7_9BASI|nr:histidinol phosphate phosphatase H [Testicularia cyperi]
MPSTLFSVSRLRFWLSCRSASSSIERVVSSYLNPQRSTASGRQLSNRFLGYAMPHSHHSHSGQFCSHAKSTLAEVLQRARDLGFTHFHLSEHVPRQNASELYPEEIEAGLGPEDLRATFEAYLVEARALQAEYSGKGMGKGKGKSKSTASMHILVGCETENISSPGTIDFLTEVLGSSRDTRPEEIGKGMVDYIVGSLHHTNAIPIDFDNETFQKSVDSFASSASSAGRQDAATPHQLLIDRYLDDQYEVLQRLRPEVVGHFDLFRLFRPETALDSPAIWAKVERNVQFAVQYGALFECNAAAFRKGWNCSYPAREILDLIVSLNGRLCLSDDSHGVHAVGLNYLRLRRYLVESNVDSIWFLEKHTPDPSTASNIHTPVAPAIANAMAEPDGLSNRDSAPTQFARGTVARCMGPEWKSLPFWQHFESMLEQETAEKQ